MPLHIAQNLDPKRCAIVVLALALAVCSQFVPLSEQAATADDDTIATVATEPAPTEDNS